MTASPDSPPLARSSQPATHTAAPGSIAFTGKGSEYFRIWVVNLVFSICTLGIYSAWATVRTRRYFYRHTRLFGHGFDFHAKPMQILKGRLLAVGCYAGYLLLSKVSPLLGAMLLSCLSLVMPWLIVQSVRFRVANTSHRGLRFSFEGKTAEAYRIYLLMPLMVVFTLGVALPFVMRRTYQYWLSNLRYGTEVFQAELSARRFFIIYLQLIGLGLLMAAVVTLGREPLVVLLQSLGVTQAIVLAPLLLLLLFWFILRPCMKARVLSHAYSQVKVGPVSFHCRLTARSMIWLAFSNFLMIACSFGLLLPFVKVRNARYLAERTEASHQGSLDEFVGAAGARTSATGDEIADVFDIGVPTLG